MSWLASVAKSAVGRFAIPLSAAVTFLGCVVVSCVLHEPVPRVHDEFSYLLMGETFAAGRVTNPPPPLPEFFDSFHVLMRPAHVSKYFPAQGIFLAMGERVTGHPAVGIWLSAGLACAATVWMLQAWLTPTWALLGGFLMILQYGIFSYWSQAYWGGLVSALGGALLFGAMRRLWDRVTLQNSLWLGLGLVILAASRPWEGLLVVLPMTFVLGRRLWKQRPSAGISLWLKLVLPFGAILCLGLCALGLYDRAITGSAFKTPYALHEEQYQESPPFIFMPARQKLAYTSPVLQYYYEVQEMKPYVTQRVPKWFVTIMARKLATWWQFYCGYALSVPLVLPALLRGGRIRAVQVGIMGALSVLSFLSSPTAVIVRGLVDLLVLAEIGLLWSVFDDSWSRLAIATCALLLLDLTFTKWAFPHYFAPAASLVLFLQAEGLQETWNWNTRSSRMVPELPRSERRRIEREKRNRQAGHWDHRWVVGAVPAACAISLMLSVVGRLNGWKEDPHRPERQALLMDDWSLGRASIDKWLEQQPTLQLVFVRYSPNHDLNSEWVYNHPDIMHAHVIWARDLGPQHNKQLLQLLPDRTVWSLDADSFDRQLVPYTEQSPPPVTPEPEYSRKTESDSVTW